MDSVIFAVVSAVVNSSPVDVVDDPRVRSLRVRQADFAKSFGLDLDQYLKIVRTFNTEDAITVLELLKASKYRSAFRERCSNKIREWVAEPLLLGRPLASWELKRCKPTWRISYSLPTF